MWNDYVLRRKPVRGYLADGKPYRVLDYKGMGDAVDFVKKLQAKVMPSIYIHADVDMDGFSSAYILKLYLGAMFPMSNISLDVNAQKEHGITEECLNRISEINPDLVIVVDSSSKMARKFFECDCDVIILDHHDVPLDMEYCTQHFYTHFHTVVINNILSGLDSNMSGCRVVYDFILALEEYIFKGQGSHLHYFLAQWVAISLYTDVIKSLSEENQYFLQLLLETPKAKMEPLLALLLDTLSKGFENSVSKSFVNYSLAPVMNRAIRAGATGEALSVFRADFVRFGVDTGILTNLVKSISKQYRKLQDDVIAKAVSSCKDTPWQFVGLDVSNVVIAKGYSGVIAAKLVNLFEKSAVVYSLYHQRDIAIAKGSFRGLNEANYLSLFREQDGVIMAEGHEGAFGFEVRLDKLADVLKVVTEHLDNSEVQVQLGIGECYMSGKRKAKFVAPNLQALGYDTLRDIATGNALITGKDELHIKADKSLFKEAGMRGRVVQYVNLDGVPYPTISFTSLEEKEVVNVYLELRGGDIQITLS